MQEPKPLKNLVSIKKKISRGNSPLSGGFIVTNNEKVCNYMMPFIWEIHQLLAITDY